MSGPKIPQHPQARPDELELISQTTYSTPEEYQKAVDELAQQFAQKIQSATKDTVENEDALRLVALDLINQIGHKTNDNRLGLDYDKFSGDLGSFITKRYSTHLGSLAEVGKLDSVHISASNASEDLKTDTVTSSASFKATQTSLGMVESEIQSIVSTNDLISAGSLAGLGMVGAEILGQATVMVWADGPLKGKMIRNLETIQQLAVQNKKYETLYSSDLDMARCLDIAAGKGKFTDPTDPLTGVNTTAGNILSRTYQNRRKIGLMAGATGAALYGYAKWGSEDQPTIPSNNSDETQQTQTAPQATNDELTDFSESEDQAVITVSDSTDSRQGTIIELKLVDTQMDTYLEIKKAIASDDIDKAIQHFTDYKRFATAYCKTHNLDPDLYISSSLESSIARLNEQRLANSARIKATEIMNELSLESKMLIPLAFFVIQTVRGFHQEEGPSDVVSEPWRGGAVSDRKAALKKLELERQGKFEAYKTLHRLGYTDGIAECKAVYDQQLALLDEAEAAEFLDYAGLGESAVDEVAEAEEAQMAAHIDPSPSLQTGLSAGVASFTQTGALSELAATLPPATNAQPQLALAYQMASRQAARTTQMGGQYSFFMGKTGPQNFRFSGGGLPKLPSLNTQQFMGATRSLGGAAYLAITPMAAATATHMGLTYAEESLGLRLPEPVKTGASFASAIETGRLAQIGLEAQKAGWQAKAQAIELGAGASRQATMVEAAKDAAYTNPRASLSRAQYYKRAGVVMGGALAGDLVAQKGMEAFGFEPTSASYLTGRLVGSVGGAYSASKIAQSSTARLLQRYITEQMGKRASTAALARFTGSAALGPASFFLFLESDRDTGAEKRRQLDRSVAAIESDLVSNINQQLIDQGSSVRVSYESLRSIQTDLGVDASDVTFNPETGEFEMAEAGESIGHLNVVHANEIVTQYKLEKEKLTKGEITQEQFDEFVQTHHTRALSYIVENAESEAEVGTVLGLVRAALGDDAIPAEFKEIGSAVAFSDFLTAQNKLGQDYHKQNAQWQVAHNQFATLQSRHKDDFGSKKHLTDLTQWIQSGPKEFTTKKLYLALDTLKDEFQNEHRSTLDQAYDTLTSTVGYLDEDRNTRLIDFDLEVIRIEPWIMKYEKTGSADDLQEVLRSFVTLSNLITGEDISIDLIIT